MSKTRVERWFVGGEVGISSKTRSDDRSRLRRDGQFEEQRIPGEMQVSNCKIMVMVCLCEG